MKEKLVRDLIPAIIEEQGKVCNYRYTASKQEYLGLLADKAGEEALELAEAGTLAEAIEEAGDLYEVFTQLLESRGVGIEEAKAAAIKKANSRGGFRSGVVLQTLVEE